MRASRWIIGLSSMLLALVMLTGPAVAGAEEAPPTGGEQEAQMAAMGLAREEQQVLWLINQARQEAGLTPLVAHPPLAGLAGARADDLVARHYFAHTTPEGETVLTMLPAWGVQYQWAGEALQRNNYGEATVEEAVRSLLASPPHRALLLDGRFGQVGVGHAQEGALHYYAIILVQLA